MDRTPYSWAGWLWWSVFMLCFHIQHFSATLPQAARCGCHASPRVCISLSVSASSPGALPQQSVEGRPLPAPLCGQWLVGPRGRLGFWRCLLSHQPFQSISTYMQHRIIWMGLLHFSIWPLPKMQPLPAGELGEGWAIPSVPLVPLVSEGCQHCGSATMSCPGTSPAPIPPPLVDESSAGDCVKLGMPERHI